MYTAQQGRSWARIMRSVGSGVQCVDDGARQTMLDAGVTGREVVFGTVWDSAAPVRPAKGRARPAAR